MGNVQNTAIFVGVYVDIGLTIGHVNIVTYPFDVQVGPCTQSLATTTVVSHRAPQNKTQITPKRVLIKRKRQYLLRRRSRADWLNEWNLLSRERMRSGTRR